jgi:murein L,D-transpeptidase YafK
MLFRLRTLVGLIAVLCLTLVLAGCGGIISKGNAKANQPLKSTVISRLASMGSSPGEAMMIRIYKESSELEVWKRTKSGQYKLFDTYQICAYSGGLGPKIKEGDRQSPEGFYTITPGLMNPNSSYYLAFNTGFPNKYDRAYGRTGSELMVHGDCTSRGCYAMTDEQIAEIYAMARESFKGGNNSFQLQIFPFRMTPDNIAKHASSPNVAFWKNLKEGYDLFELTRQPPVWDVCGRKYVFNAVAKSGQPLDPVASCPALVTDETLTARLVEKQAADEAEVATQVADLNAKAAREAAEAQKAAEEKAALKARGEAIGSFVSGVFGGEQVAATPTDPSVKPPVPRPRIKRG